MPTAADPPAPAQQDLLAARERDLWIAALSVLCSFAVGLALASWPPAVVWSSRLGVIVPPGVVVLAFLFAIYVWRQKTEIATLRSLVRGAESGTAARYTPKQLDRLFSLIATSQHGFRELIDTFEDPLFSVQLDGRILTVNRRFVELLAKSFPEVVGRLLQEFFEFTLPQGATEQLMSSLQDGRPCSEILQVRVKHTGATYYFNCIFHAIVRDGALHGISGLARDVTHARESEIRYTELFGTLHEGVYIASADDRITEANPALAKMLGLADQAALKGAEISSFYQAPQDRAQERVTLDAAGFLRTREVALKRLADGRKLLALHSCVAVRDASGKVIRTQGTLLDITERRHIERRLQREEEFARRLIDSFPDVVTVLDRDGRYSFVSPQVAGSLGYQPEELIGCKLIDLVDPEDRRALAVVFEDLTKGRGQRRQVEFRKRHKDGGWRLIRATAGPLQNQSGGIAGVIASERDITDQHRLQQQLVQSERLAAMGQMIAGVAHELNNPLTAILGITELMRDQSLDEHTRRHLDLAYRQARRAASIVEDLLAFSRPVRSQSTLLHLGDLLGRTLQFQEHSLRSHKIVVDFDASSDLPTILGDPSQLTQVFLNLIVNAEQAIGEVRDHGTLTIRISAAGEHVLITFQDDGGGISREVLPRIFDPFFTTKRPGGGTGLGLSICMSIIREHKGDISAQPLPGGSLFTVSLPACVQAPAVSELVGKVAHEACEEVSVRAASPLAGRRILVVDDEDGIRQFIGQSLAGLGIEADSAASGEDAMRLLLSQSYDAVLCDVDLKSAGGGINGLQLHERFCSALAGKAAPAFVFMTGELLHGALDQNLRGTGRPFLQKPFRIAEMVSVLTESVLLTTPR